MRSGVWGLLLGVASWSAVAAVGQQRSPAPKSPTYESAVLPFVKKHCAACHAGSDSPAGVDFTAITRHSQMVSNPAFWDRVLRAVGRGSMPPEGRPRVAAAERQAFLDAVQSILATECRIADPGRVTLRRLNRVEFDNTVRDLTGVVLKLSEDFPSDDVGHGFDNIGDVLSISPLLMEKYLAAAERIAAAAIILPERRKTTFSGESLSGDGGVRLNGDSWAMFARGSISINHTVSKGGDYRLDILAYGDQAGADPARMALIVDSRPLQTFDVSARRSRPEQYGAMIKLGPGRHSIALEFVNDFYQPNDPDPANRDRNLHILSLSLDGPIGNTASLPASHRQLVPLNLTNQTVNEAIEKMALRGYRRPPTPDELSKLGKLYQLAISVGEPPERGLQLVLQALLASPHFLFRVELDPGKVERKLGAYELASRISYFLWSSMPDEALLGSAKDGSLLTPAGLSAQVTRMLADSKAKALTDNFLGQWLQLRKLDVISPDPKLFPEFTPELRDSMRKETELLFEAILKENRSLVELLSSEFSYINGPLAEHYAITGVSGPAHQKVNVSKARLGGLLGHASILALTSNPTRTSPVKRGKWILENLLGDPTPPPPPNTGVLDDKPNEVTGKTLRERLEQHRKNPECAGCHARLDPWGLALDAYGPLGKKRSQNEGEPINLVVKLPDGTLMSGPQDVRAQLLKRKGEFVRCFVEKLMIYAVGRGMTPADRCHIDQVVSEGSDNQNRVNSLILSVIKSKPFQMKGSNP